MSTSDSIRPLETTNLRWKSYSAIRGRIITGEIEAGRLYPVAYFASRLGVSATPVREALFDLANEGLVEVVRNRGFRVVRLTDSDLNEIFELRLMLEVPNIAKLCGTLSEAQLEEHRAEARDIERFAHDGDLVGFLDADRRFHLSLLGRLKNRRLADIVGRLRDQSRLYGLPSLLGSHDLIASTREHSDLLDSIAGSDASRVIAAMTRHLEHTRGIWAGVSENAGGGPAQ